MGGLRNLSPLGEYVSEVRAGFRTIVTTLLLIGDLLADGMDPEAGESYRKQSVAIWNHHSVRVRAELMEQ